MRRNGKHLNIMTDDLLVGDIMQINIGDILSVDGILTVGSGKSRYLSFLFSLYLDVLMDESSITGESNLIKKFPLSMESTSSPNPFMISGSKVMDGEGHMLVCTVGSSTRIGLN